MANDLNAVRKALLAALPAGTTNELVLAQVDRAAELTVLSARLGQKAWLDGAPHEPTPLLEASDRAEDVPGDLFGLILQGLGRHLAKKKCLAPSGRMT